MDTNEYLHTVFNNYDRIINEVFLDRYLPFEKLKAFLKTDIFNYFENDVIGYSEQNKPIYSIDVGQGNQKILIWSQMHGNESTTTKSILDVLNWFKQNRSDEFVNKVLQECHIKFIPILNPDGAKLYTRFNANDEDLNRDAVKQSQAETMAFFSCLQTFNPDYCFNMHGQRTIFSAGEDEFPATLSFLAPSYNKSLDINKSREKAIQLIANAVKSLENFIPHQIGRYDDAHNPNCYGDFIQKMGISTILYEAGHYADDYCRNETRKFVTLSLLIMFEEISNSLKTKSEIDSYIKIPMNQDKYLDIIVKDVKYNGLESVGIHYQEVLNDKTIIFQPFLKQIKDLDLKYAHKYIDGNGQDLLINGKKESKIGTLIKELKLGAEIVDLRVDVCR